MSANAPTSLFGWDPERETVVYARPNARRTDPETSHQAARLAEPKAGTNRELALRTLRQHPDGLTDFELAELTGLQQNSVGKRRGELRDAGLVEDTGRRRPSLTGAPAIVWRATRD
jgi:DNA-binding transcriptional ArsR family regulator